MVLQCLMVARMALEDLDGMTAFVNQNWKILRFGSLFWHPGALVLFSDSEPIRKYSQPSLFGRTWAIKFKRYPRLRPSLADFALKRRWPLQVLRRWPLQALRWRPLQALCWRLLQALLMSGADCLERVGCFVRTTSQLFVTVCPAGQKS